MSHGARRLRRTGATAFRPFKLVHLGAGGLKTTPLVRRERRAPFRLEFVITKCSTGRLCQLANRS